ncbi:MAG: PIN domain-containing protein [Ignavibacteriae bacterium]|nr:PIN domain-containing protein [Ignavibacteriota bacterium]
MKVFLDTSAFLAVLDEDDENHESATNTWNELITNDKILITSNYIIVETLALAQHRFGLESVRVFQEDIYPLLQIVWMDKLTHEQAINNLLTFSRRKLSYVDCTSFQVMRELSIEGVFCFDEHFVEQGFTVVIHS